MKNTRRIFENDRLFIYNNLDEDLILCFKVNNTDVDYSNYKCSLCNGHSYRYFIVPRLNKQLTLCNLCFTWNKKTFDWKTIYYTSVFNQIINYVKNHKDLFTDESLNQINKFFDSKTNKHINIYDYIRKEN